LDGLSSSSLCDDDGCVCEGTGVVRGKRMKGVITATRTVLPYHPSMAIYLRVLSVCRVLSFCVLLLSRPEQGKSFCFFLLLLLF
jgi:hypothetical protein